MESSDRALFELKLRVELEPTNVAALLALAEHGLRLGLEEEAHQAFDRVLALDPANPTARDGRLHCFRACYARSLVRGDGYERAALVHQVGELRDPTATPWLIELLSSPEAVVRQKAAEALGRTGDRAAVPALVRVVRTDSACAWWQAAEALAAIGDRTAVQPLLAILATGSTNARTAAAHALGLLGDPAAAACLAQALREGDVPVRRAAAAALGQLGSRAAVPALAPALDDSDRETRAAALASLGALVGHTFRPFLLWSPLHAARRWWKAEGRHLAWAGPGSPQERPKAPA